tara:strand:+ start:7175 stop:7804 length:630 start_codon:yes stop_codon:yes gene_type:complete
MKTAICYRGHYYRKGGKGSNFFLCYENHKRMLLDYYPNSDIYFHSHSVNLNLDSKLVDLLKPKKYSFKKTTYISDSFIETNNQIDLDENYDIVLNLRFDLMFQRPILDFFIDSSKFNFTWEERKHYRVSLGYHKVTDLMFAMNTDYINHFNNACIDSRFNGGIRGTGHHLYPFLCESIGEENINFMVDDHYDSNTDGKNNKYLLINRNS